MNEPMPSDAKSVKSGYFRLYGLVFAASTLLYALTAQRGVAWQDSGIFQNRILEFDLTGWLGLALAHPVLILVGKLFSGIPFGPLAWRLNLVSAVFAAGATANVAVLAARVSKSRRWGPAFAAGALGLGHTFWWLATICESQVIEAFWLTLEWNLVWTILTTGAVWPGLALAAVSGLGFATHNLALLAVPAYLALAGGMVWRRRWPVWILPAGLGAWALGAMPMLVLVAQQAMASSVPEAVRSALFGRSWQGAVVVGRANKVFMGAAYVVYQFPNLALPLAAGGLAWAVKRYRAFGAVMAYMLGIYMLFAIRYDVPDQFMFFLPAYSAVAVLAGLAVGRLALNNRRLTVAVAAASVVVTPLLYVAATAAWRRWDLPLPGRKDLAYRDPVRYWLIPWKHDENSAGRFARAALQQAAATGPAPLILTDHTVLPALQWTQRVHRIGPGVELGATGQWQAAASPPGRAVLVVSRRPSSIPSPLSPISPAALEFIASAAGGGGSWVGAGWPPEERHAYLAAWLPVSALREDPSGPLLRVEWRRAKPREGYAP